MAVAAGVGISASFGMLRIVRNWSIKPIAIYLSAMTLALSSYVNWWVAAWFSGQEARDAFVFEFVCIADVFSRNHMRSRVYHRPGCHVKV